jgi:hypothetical protein
VLESQERTKKQMEMRVSGRTEDEDEEDEIDTRFLHTIQNSDGKHMDRRFFKNIDSDYLM